MRVGIIGASGYTGGELLRLLLRHPKVELTIATSRKHEGEYLYRVHPNLRGLTDMKFQKHDVEAVVERSDLVFTALPHGTSMNFMPRLVEGGVKVIDLSADFRLRDPKAYEIWYGFKHPCPELLERFVYGLPELHRDEIRGASYVATPGCTAMATILALAPLVEAGIVELDRLVADVKIGSSGAGASPSIFTHFSERFGVVRPYKPVMHRHTGEVEQELSGLVGEDVRVAMTPHGVNMVRGILSTCHSFLSKEVGIPDLWRAYRRMYGKEPFVRLIRDLKGLYRYPDPKMVIGSNFADVGFELDGWAKRVVSFCAIDNLMKGAAGTAVQCMNLMLGYDERTGLETPPLHPV